jgi:hypothetical protein
MQSHQAAKTGYEEDAADWNREEHPHFHGVGEMGKHHEQKSDHGENTRDSTCPDPRMFHVAHEGFGPEMMYSSFARQLQPQANAVGADGLRSAFSVAVAKRGLWKVNATPEVQCAGFKDAPLAYLGPT